jgi:hypothetical protein
MPATLAKWKNLVFGTADFMADYSVRDPATGQYNLDPVWPACEGRQNPLRRNTIFELAYWHVGLEMAQQWRLRLGLPREPHWDAVASQLAPLPQKDGLYIFSDDRPDTFITRTFDHVDNIGIAGMLPPFQGLDAAMAKRTVEEVSRNWNWDATWGWDFPWMAMAAARVGDPNLAVDALLNPSRKNHGRSRSLSARQWRPALCRGHDDRRLGRRNEPERAGFPQRRFVDGALGKLKARALTGIFASMAQRVIRSRRFIVCLRFDCPVVNVAN